MAYHIEYDGTMSTVQRGVGDEETYSTFGEARAILVEYMVEMRDDWAGALRDARRLRAREV